MNDYNNNINNTMTDCDLVKINDDELIKSVIHSAIRIASEPLVSFIRETLPKLVAREFGNKISMTDPVMDGLAVSISLVQSKVTAKCSTLDCPYKIVNDYRNSEFVTTK